MSYLDPYGLINVTARGGLPNKREAVFYARLVAGQMVDIIGISISDYLLVPVDHRSIYFVDETEMHSDEQILINIAASEFLNDGGEMVGNPLIGYAQYSDGTSGSILRRAYRYFRVAYPEPTYWQWSDNTNMEWSDGSPMERGS